MRNKRTPTYRLMAPSRASQHPQCTCPMQPTGVQGSPNEEGKHRDATKLLLLSMQCPTKKKQQGHSGRGGVPPSPADRVPIGNWVLCSRPSMCPASDNLLRFVLPLAVWVVTVSPSHPLSEEISDRGVNEFRAGRNDKWALEQHHDDHQLQCFRWIMQTSWACTIRNGGCVVPLWCGSSCGIYFAPSVPLTPPCRFVCEEKTGALERA